MRTLKVTIPLLFAALLLAAVTAGAQEPEPEIVSIDPSGDYTSVDVQFSVAVYTGTVAEGETVQGEGTPVAGDFTVAGLPAGVTLATVERVDGRDNDVVRLRFADGETDPAGVAANLTEIRTVAGSLYSAQGTSIGQLTALVPFTGADVTRLLSALEGIDVALTELGEIPFAGAWLANFDAATEQFHGRSLADLVPGAGEALDDLLTGTPTQAAAEDALADLAAFAGVEFTAAGVRVALADGMRLTEEATHELEIDGLGLDLTTTLGIDVGLEGAVEVVLDGTGALLDAAGTSLTLHVDADAIADIGDVRLGFVDVTLDDARSSVGFAATLALDCGAAPACAPSNLGLDRATVTGEARLDIPEVEVTVGGTAYPFEPPETVSVVWGLDDLPLPDPEADGPTLLPTIEDLDAWQAVELHHFLTLDFEALVGSLSWLATWLTTIESHGLMNTELPLVGRSAGDLAPLAMSVGEKVDALLELVGGSDPSAQEVTSLLCSSGIITLPGGGACDDRLTFDLDAWELRYALSIGLDLEVFPEGHEQLVLALTDELDSIDVSVDAGDWSASTGSASLNFGLGLKLLPDADLEARLDAHDPPDAPEIEDPALRDYTLVVGDLCRGLARTLGVSLDDLLTANGDLNRNSASDLATCDSLVATGASVSVPGSAAVSLSGGQVCESAANVWSRDVSVFRTLNGYAGDAACANAVAPGATFHYDAPSPDVRLGHRVFVEPTDQPFLALELDLVGTGIGAGLTLGFLDLALTGGEVRLSPAASVSLHDPAWTLDDGYLDLVELAAAADARRLDDLLSLDFGGAVTATLDLENNLLDIGNPGLDVAGDLSALARDEVFAFQFARVGDVTARAAQVSEPIAVGLHLGDWYNLRDLTAAQVLAMLADAMETLGQLAGSEVLDYEIPFTEVSLQDMAAFTRRTARVAEAVEARDPGSLSAFADALADALHEAGMPQEITVSLDGSGGDLALAFGVRLNYTRTDSYPFSLSLSAFDDSAVPISPFDGGARVSATTTVTYEPTIGVLLTGSAPALERVFLTGDPSFAAVLDAEIAGDAYLGPLGVSLSGSAAADPSLTVGLTDLGTGGRVTIADIQDAIRGTRLPGLTWGGEFEAELGVGPNPRGSVHVGSSGGGVQGPIAIATLMVDPSAVDVSVDFDWSSLRLDLETLVRGTVQTSRFVGNLLRRSDALSDGLPLIGDELTRLTSVGEDFRTLANEIEQAWETANNEAAPFLAEIEGTIAGAICGGLPSELGCSVELWLGDGGGGYVRVDPSVPVDIGTLDDLQIRLAFGQSLTIGDGPDDPLISGGLDLGVLDLDLETTLDMTLGYRASLVLGLSMDEGFYVDAGSGDGSGGALLELFATVDATIDTGVAIAGIEAARLRDGRAVLKGHGAGLGPDGDAAGFAIELEQRLTLVDLANRRTPVDRIIKPRLTLDAMLDLPIVLADGLDVAPTITFPVLFTWGIDADLRDELDLPKPDLWVGYPAGVHPDGVARSVSIDATEIVEGVLKPIVAEIAQYNPINAKPISDALDHEIELLETSVRDLIDTVASQSPAWRGFTFFVDFSNLIDKLDAADISGDIELGWGHIVASDLSSRPYSSTPHFEVNDDWDVLFSDLRQMIDDLSALAGGPSNYRDSSGSGSGGSGAGGSGSSVSTSSSGSTIGATGQVVKFPLLDQPLDVLTLVLGGELRNEVTFIEIAPPTIDIGKAIKFNQTLFDLDVGFLEGNLTVGFEGAVGLTLRVGVGFSSRGLQNGNPLHGLYLVDAMEGGRSLPAVALGGRIGAYVDGKFGISVAGIDVASARFTGSGRARLEAGLDLYSDAPTIEPKPGRFYVDDIVTTIQTHSLTPGSGGGFLDALDSLCMFRPMIGFYADLSFSGKARFLGSTVWSGGWSSDWPGIEASTTCTINPQPAKLVDGELILNAGPEAADRFDNAPNRVESFQVRMAGGGTQVEVRWTGLAAGTYQVRTWPLDEVKVIRATLGVRQGQGGTVDIGADVPVPAIIVGSDAADTITTGAGDDVVDARGGANQVTVRGGENVVRVGNGGGRVTMAGGDNVVDGGTGPTTYAFAGQWGRADVAHLGSNAVLDFTGAAGGVHATSAYGFGEVRLRAGGGALAEYVVEDVAKILGSLHDDVIEVGSDAPDGLLVDGQDGDDLVVVDMTARESREVTVTDSGPASDDDRLELIGTRGDDEFLLRARPRAPSGPLAVADVDLTAAAAPVDAGELGLVALVGRTTSGGSVPVERVRSDDTIDLLVLDGVDGANEFSLDDTATEVVVEGGPGGSSFQVGQIFGRTGEDNHYRVADFGVGEGDEIRTRDVRGRGPMSLGVSHPATLRGGTSDDFFQVYSNVAGLELEGVSGNNTFVIRAFILEGSVKAIGGDGNDFFEYVQNELVEIDGGDGYNTMIVIGTEGSDGFVLDEGLAAGSTGDAGAADVGGFEVCPVLTRTPFVEGGVELRPAVPADASVDRLPWAGSDACGVEVQYQRIQRVVLVGAYGNNAFWVRSTSPEREFVLLGGRDGDTFLVGDAEVEWDVEGSGGAWSGGDVTGIQGPVRLAGDGRDEREFDLSVPAPVVLPGEDATTSSDPEIPDYDVVENRMVVDGTAHTSDDVGRLDSGVVDGLGMGLGGLYGPPGDEAELPGGVAYAGIDFVDVLLGSGDDRFTVESTATFTRLAEVDVDGAAELGPAQVLGLLRSGGDPEVVRTHTVVRGGPGDDRIAVQTIAGHTVVDGQTGDDVVRVGTAAVPDGSSPDRASTMVGITNALHVIGGPGSGDELYLDASGVPAAVGEPGERVDVAPGLVTELSMPGQVSHAEVELLDITLTEGEDVANVRGTSTRTVLHGLDADDRFFVSDEAAYAVADATPPLLPGTLADVASDLEIEAGFGANTLMVSDRDTASPVVGAVLDADLLSGFADGEIAYRTSDGGTFAGGVTVWTRADSLAGGDAGDEVSVVGARRDGDPTTLAWEQRPSGMDVRTITTLNTGAGDDAVSVALDAAEHGFFVLNTGPGDDIVTGASSTLGFVVFGGEGNDVIETGSGDDLVFGDLGMVEYSAGGRVVTSLGDADVANRNDGVARRPTRIVTVPGAVVGEPGADGFHNRIATGDGDDIAFGGLGDARIDASGGRNALIGDHGEVWRLSTVGRARTISAPGGFIDVDVLGDAPFSYTVDVFDGEGGGDDVITGGTGDDTIFAGLGNDVIVGSPGDGSQAREGGDVIFAGDGDDIVWGGPGDDRIYGGNGDTFVNLKRPSFDAGVVTRLVHSPQWWERAWAFAPAVDAVPSPDRSNGDNLVYGGRGRDVLAADSGAGGPRPGDRLINFYGSYNLFLVCDGAYGAGRVLRQPSPGVLDALIELAGADGAFEVHDEASSGWHQLALVTREHAAANRGQPHPDHPGNNSACY